MNGEIGSKFDIQYYKHDGKLYRHCEEVTLIDKKDDYIVVANNNTIMIEADGRVRKTREPAIIYFFKDKWYNIIVQLKKRGTSYYCNICSPFIVEDKTIKYIDYDLDLRIYNTKEFEVLDRAEYIYHKNIYNYSDDLDKVINNSLTELIQLYKSGFEGFNEENNQLYYKTYLNLKNTK